MTNQQIKPVPEQTAVQTADQTGGQTSAQTDGTTATPTLEEQLKADLNKQTQELTASTRLPEAEKVDLRDEATRLRDENPWLRGTYKEGMNPESIHTADQIDVRQAMKENPNMTPLQMFRKWQEYQKAQGKEADYMDLLAFTRNGQLDPTKSGADNKKDKQRAMWAEAIDHLGNIAYHALNAYVGHGMGNKDFNAARTYVGDQMRQKNEALRKSNFDAYMTEFKNQDARKQEARKKAEERQWEMQKFEAQERLKRAIAANDPIEIAKYKNQLLDIQKKEAEVNKINNENEFFRKFGYYPSRQGSKKASTRTPSPEQVRNRKYKSARDVVANWKRDDGRGLKKKDIDKIMNDLLNSPEKWDDFLRLDKDAQKDFLIRATEKKQ